MNHAQSFWLEIKSNTAEEMKTTITYRFEPSSYGILVTVRDEDFIGRSQAAFGNAKIWEIMLGWLDDYVMQKDK